MRFVTLLLAISALSVNARTSVNFGPVTSTSKSFITRDEHVDAFHSLGSVHDLDPEAIAIAFVAHKHPRAEFELQSSVRSDGSGVSHIHFVQTLGGREIVDGLLNVNIDETSGQILSYGDSFHVDRCAQLEAKFTRDAERAIKDIDSGLVMQTSSTMQALTDSISDELAACVSPFVSKHKAAIKYDEIVDPALALVSFLLPIHNAKGNHLSEDDAGRLVDSIVIEHPLRRKGRQGENWINLHNVIDAEEAVPARLAYISGEDGLELIWRFEYRSNDNWYELGVAAESKDGLATKYAVDWMRDFAPLDDKPSPPIKKPGQKRPKHKQPDESKQVTDPHAATYRIYRWGCNDPSSCHRSLVRDPADFTASPNGWHQIPREPGWTGRSLSAGDLTRAGWSSSSSLRGGLNSTTTVGNNVWAQDNVDGGNSFELNYRPVNDSLIFDYHLGWAKANRSHTVLEPHSYINVSVTELFATCNRMHDLMYRYGFDEQSGNFQQHNYGSKGLGGDPVVANAQDGSGTNNANFATPPDGRSGRMRMFRWSDSVPERDGDLEEGIVIHEYAHGVSTRLVGGPANSGCLGFGEAGGMGEGIGDFIATMARLQTNESYKHDHTMGRWAAGMPGGIRKYPYSTNMTLSPEIYSTLDGFAYWGVHAIGETFGVMWNEVAVGLMDAHGWAESLFPPQPSDLTAQSTFYKINKKTGKKYPAHGNTLVIQLLINALKLAPCRPSFFNMRDAMLQADQHLTGGENECIMWKAFAKRGLGPNAQLIGSTPWGGGKRTDDFQVPLSCRKTKA